MREKRGALDLGGLGVEDVDEQLADRLALGFRIGDAGQGAQEHVLGIHVDQRDVVVVAEQRHDLRRLVLAQEARVDEDAGQLMADRLVDQHGGNRTIDPARQAADDLAFADLGANARHLLVAERLHRPIAGEAADFEQEVPDHVGAARRVHDFRVELHGVELALFIGDGGEGRAFRHGDDLEAFRDGGDAVAVAHPHGFSGVQALEDR